MSGGHINWKCVMITGDRTTWNSLDTVFLEGQAVQFFKVFLTEAERCGAWEANHLFGIAQVELLSVLISVLKISLVKMYKVFRM
jgi:hypothetical protein